MSLLPRIALIVIAALTLAAGPTSRPVLQLTAQPPRQLDRDDCVPDPTLRELHRQAVLIAAREELGYRTRDQVLDEPFAAESPEVATVLIESRVQRHGRSTVAVSRFTGTPPAAAYELADKTVDGPGTGAVRRFTFKTPGVDVPDYPAFVAECERLSRTELVEWLRNHGPAIPGDGRPIAWASDGKVTNEVDVRLGRFDVFDQYLAVRLAHDQSAAAGASVDRTAALVRGYANLGRLTRRQWSFASKAFAARSLLYAERLVVHENSSAPSLYVRAYARALAGLHKAALDDLALAGRSGEARPPWTDLADGVCRFDLPALVAASRVGPARLRSTAAALSVAVGKDVGTPYAWSVIGQVSAAYPALLERRAGMQDYSVQRFNNYGQAGENVLGVVAVVLNDALSNAALPAEVVPAVDKVTTWQDGAASMGELFKSLNKAAATDVVEPSVGALAGLVLQQEFLGLLDKADAAPRYGDSTAIDQVYKPAAVFVEAHPWGPLVSQCVRSWNAETTDRQKYKAAVAGLKPRHTGPWCQELGNAITVHSDDLKTLTDKFITVGAKLVDETAYERCESAESALPPNGMSADAFLLTLWRASPYCGEIAGRYLRSVPLDRVRAETSTYQSVMDDVSTRFMDRPNVLAAAADWSDARSDFKRSAELVARANSVNPSALLYRRLARLARHGGDMVSAMSYIDRAISFAPGTSYNADSQSYFPPTDTAETSAVITKANWLCEAGKAAEAVDLIQSHPEEQSDSRALLVLGRSNELAGHPDDAATAYRAATAVYPQFVRKQYAYARRLGRPDADELKKSAADVAANRQIAGADELSCQLNLINGDRHKAFLDGRRDLPQLSYWTAAEVVILAAEYHHKDVIKSALARMDDSGNTEFARLLSDLTTTKDRAAVLTAFDQWRARQLDDELLGVYESIVGRYLLTVGQKDDGVRYIKATLARPQREMDAYFLAWQAMQAINAGP